MQQGSELEQASCGAADDPGLDADDARPVAYGRANLPPWVIASRDFHDHPSELHIVGVRRENRAFFSLLARLDSPDERGRWFDAYMNEKFYLDQWPLHTPGARRSLRNSYLRFRVLPVRARPPLGAPLPSVSRHARFRAARGAGEACYGRVPGTTEQHLLVHVT